jgi:hypothetical protein
MEYVRGRRAELEEESGVEIELVQDDSLQVSARAEIAWHRQAARHVVRYQVITEAITPHLIAHELEHIAMEGEARAAGRNRFFITTPETEDAVLRAIAGDIYSLKRKLPREAVDKYIQTLLRGFADRLFNMPLDMIIESRLWEDHPAIRPSQFVSLHKAYQDGLRSLTDRETSVRPSSSGLSPGATARPRISIAELLLFFAWTISLGTHSPPCSRLQEECPICLRLSSVVHPASDGP